MNINITQRIALSIFILAFAGTVMLSYDFFRPERVLPLNQKRIERIVQQKEEKLQQVLSRTKKALKSRSPRELVKSQDPLLSEETLKQEGFSIFIYKNDTLNYWTDNKISVAGNFSKTRFRERIVEYNNGWYLTAYVRDSLYQAGGTFLIKHKYPYHNQFLQNNFHQDLGIQGGSRYRIEFVETSMGLPIKDAKGQYLFSIMEKESSGSSLLEDSLANAFLFLMLIGLLLAVKPLVENHYGLLLAALLVLAGIRYLMIRFSFPDVVYRSALFDQLHFHSVPWLRSSGDVLVNTLILFYLALLTYFKPTSSPTKYYPQFVGFLVAIAGWLVTAALAWGLQEVFTRFITLSQAPLTIDQPLSLNFSTLVLFLVATGLLAAFVLLVYKLFYHIRAYSQNAMVLLAAFAVYGAALLYLWFAADKGYLFQTALTGLLILAAPGAFYGFKQRMNDYRLLSLLVIAAIYLAFFVNGFRQIKITESGKQIARELKDSRDQFLEDYLAGHAGNLSSDEQLACLVKEKNPGSMEQVDQIKEYLYNNYFFEHLSLFALTVTVCGPEKDFVEKNQLANCQGYFSGRIDKFGRDIAIPNFYFLETQDGATEYLGKFSYSSKSGKRYLLFVQLQSKPGAYEAAYPALLTKNETDTTRVSHTYSYAIYRNNKLVKRGGDYYYSPANRRFNNLKQNYTIVEDENFVHLVYKHSPKNKVILTRPAQGFRDYAVIFSYIFLFLIVITYVFLLLISGRSILRNINLNFKNRIKLAMLLVLILSFILIGSGTIYLNKQQFEAKHRNRIVEKIKSVSSELEEAFEGSNSLAVSLRLKSPDNEDSYLKRKISSVFHTNVNVYGINGQLLASSRPAIFRGNLVSARMNPEAFRHLAIENAPRFIHNEEIGTLEYAAAYIPIYNNSNEKLGYLHLPYFTRPQILGQDITNMLITILNIYVLLLIVTSAIAVLIANQVTHPLHLLEQKFRAVRIGKRNEPIEYKGNDEIGRIVTAYNEMMNKLTDSIEKLAETEREMAWREMARQIAHEIRNPLTPMKLSIQHLQKSWRNKPDKFAARFEDVSQTLIEQIETLSAIANEFSNFAKMPTPNMEAFNVISRLENVILLFENTEQDTHITFENNKLERLDIMSDKEQIQRVFINLIKNGIQSIPYDRPGKIHVTVQNSEDYALISISDNGNGIPEDKRDKLFRPSFTTKSGGMGMGLAIVKNIVEATEGRIWFETEIGQGTTFYLRLPLAKADTYQAKHQEA